MEKTTITIKETHCASCKVLIEDIASETEGITSCKVNFSTGETEIEHEQNADLEKFKKEVESMGDYKVELKK